MQVTQQDHGCKACSSASQGRGNYCEERDLSLQVLNKLRDFAEEDICRTSILLLPSIRDVHHDPVFPQPPFQSTLPPSIRALTNPATFRVNEVVIGAATADTLKQVRPCCLPGLLDLVNCRRKLVLCFER